MSLTFISFVKNKQHSWQGVPWSSNEHVLKFLMLGYLKHYNNCLVLKESFYPWECVTVLNVWNISAKDDNYLVLKGFYAPQIT